jgi:hypothetical protein
MQRTVILIILILAARMDCKAQDSIPPEIKVEEKGDSVHFSARLRPLRQLAGAPTTFYTYFWELGDGRFSFEKDPLYSYRDTGDYQVRLYATNNYDDGKAPPTRPHPVKIRKRPTGKSQWASHFFHGAGNIEMKINRNPRPGEDFIALIGYRNLFADTLSGSVVLFFNERQLGRDGFALADQRYYNREDSSSLDALLASLDPAGLTSDGGRVRNTGFAWNRSSAAEDGQAYSRIWTEAFEEEANYRTQTRALLHSLEADYTRHTVLHFSRLPQGEEKFVFMDLNTLPGMLQDTNATVNLTAMLVPDNPTAAPELYDLGMQVVSSHDPNRLQLERPRINYRFFRRRKELTYKVHFQNTGKGPARKIAIAVSIPTQLNGSTIRLKSVSPGCRWCDSVSGGESCIDTFRRADSIYFILHHIYLRGLEQEGVKDEDSTKGFVEYSIRFRKKPPKKPFRSGASIVFDEQPPVQTNKATAKFIKGLSPGVMGGYNIFPANGSYSTTGPIQIGYVLAPYSPYRPYFQAEVSASVFQQETVSGPVIKVGQDTTINGLLSVLVGRQTTNTIRRNSLEVTPLHFRYNLNSWIGIGIGATARINITEQTVTDNKIYFSPQLLPSNIMTSVNTMKTAIRAIPGWQAEPFADIEVGRVRTGPVIGLRYLYQVDNNTPNRFFLYGAIKL